MKRRRLPHTFFVLLVAAFLVVSLNSTMADGGSATWNGQQNNNWIPSQTGGNQNWSTGNHLFPGTVNTLTNTDTATFNIAGGNPTITLNPALVGGTTLNLQNITFDTAAGSFTIGTTGGPSLVLTSGGTIQIAATLSGTGKTETINAPIVLAPTNGTSTGSYTFSNNATSSTNVLNFGGGITGGTTTSSITLTLNGSNTGANTISGAIGNGGASGGVAVTKSGSGTWILSGANTYTGGTTINAGLLQAGSNTALGNANNTLTVNGGTLDLNGKTVGVGNLTGSGGTILNNATGTNITFTIGNGNATGGNYQGVIADHSSGTGTVALTKTGTGTLTLSGANTYTGATIINNGTLALDNNGTITPRLVNTTSITVNSGGTLLLAGTSTSTDRINNAAAFTLNGGTFNTGGFSEQSGTVAAPTFGLGALTLTATSTIDFGAGASIIEFNGLGTHTASTILQLTNWSGTPVVGGGIDRLLFTGVSSAFTSLYTQSDVSFNGIVGYKVDQFAGFYEVTEVPEPRTFFAGALALAAVGFTQRRRLKSLLPRKAAASV